MQKRIKKLCDAGFIDGERILWSGEKAYKISKQGCQLIQDDLKPLNKINLGTFMHDMQFLDLAVRLKKEHNFVELIPERRLKHLNGLNDKMNKGHMSDCVLITEDDKKIAIELELTVKSKARMNKIIADFTSDFDLDEVWYYTPSPSVQRAITKASSDHADFIKIYEL